MAQSCFHAVIARHPQWSIVLSVQSIAILPFSIFLPVRYIEESLNRLYPLRRAFSKSISFRLFFFVLRMPWCDGLSHTNALWGGWSIGYLATSGTATAQFDSHGFSKAVKLHLTMIYISWCGSYFLKRGGCSHSALGRRPIEIQRLLQMEVELRRRT